ncbi:MAG: hypothetical protein JNK78_01555 [Planctomycetes bacterium]|nr:hypothetical protein [Planctomycetota bacterium]
MRAAPVRRFLAPLLATAACSAPPPMPDPPASHPACPAAAAAPERPMSDALTMPERRPTPPSTGGRGH